MQAAVGFQPSANRPMHFFLTFGGMKPYCLSRIFLLFVLVGALLLGAACSSQKPTELSFELLPANFTPMYNELPATVYAVNSQAAWDSLSKRLQLQFAENEMDLTGYFKTHTLLLVYAGWQRTTGYQLDTKALTQTGKLITVQAKLFTPGEGCLMADMITFPMQLLAVPKGKKRTYSLQMQAEAKACR